MEFGNGFAYVHYIMAKIIFYTDLHHGANLIYPNDPNIYGNYALAMNAAILNYAKLENVDVVIHGGDESSYNPDVTTHVSRAHEIKSQMAQFDGDLHRVIGNHEPIGFMSDLGLHEESYEVENSESSTRVLIQQPEINRSTGELTYSYNRHSGFASPQQPDQNIILARHWAFDRMARGYPEIYRKAYLYHDRLKEDSDALASMIAGNLAKGLTLHGHEHRFSLSENMGYQCLVMPSIAQEDIDCPDKPCGLFVEITDDALGGGLRLSFKKINLNDEQPEQSNITEVTPEYMQRYHRPVIIQHRAAPQ